MAVSLQLCSNFYLIKREVFQFCCSRLENHTHCLTSYSGHFLVVSEDQVNLKLGESFS